MNKTLLFQNKKIAYQVTGTGKPVVLVHGFGEEASVWKNQAGKPPETPPILRQAQEEPLTPLSENALLENKFKFIIPDLPGSGESEMIDDMSMEGMAEVIKAIIDVESSEKRVSPTEVLAPLPPEGGFSASSKLNKSFPGSESKAPPSEGFGEASLSVGRGASSQDKETCTIIGHSMGGYITLAFAEKYPDQLNAFGLFHSSAFADSEEKKATRRKGIEFINQHGGFEFMKTAIPNLYSPQTKAERPELIKSHVADAHNFSPGTLVSYYEAMMKRPDRTAVLEKSAIPVLFIMGKYDMAVPLEDGLKQCHMPEKSYIHVLQNSGHMGMLEEREESNRVLEKFLLEI